MHLYADGGDSNEIVQLYESATRLSPHDAQSGLILETATIGQDVPTTLLTLSSMPRRLFPNSPEINWRLANSYVRAAIFRIALHTLRMVLLEDAAPKESLHAREETRRVTRTNSGNASTSSAHFFNYLNFRIEEGTSPRLKRFGHVFFNGTCLLTCARPSLSRCADSTSGVGTVVGDWLP